MLRCGIVELSKCPSASLLVLVKKNDGRWRFCMDYRKINVQLYCKIHLPASRITDALSRLEGSQFFPMMDLQSGYHHMPVKDSTKRKPAYITADGLFQFLNLPWINKCPGHLPKDNEYHPHKPMLDILSSIPRRRDSVLSHIRPKLTVPTRTIRTRPFSPLFNMGFYGGNG